MHLKKSNHSTLKSLYGLIADVLCHILFSKMNILLLLSSFVLGMYPSIVSTYCIWNDDVFGSLLYMICRHILYNTFATTTMESQIIFQQKLSSIHCDKVNISWSSHTCIQIHNLIINKNSHDTTRYRLDRSIVFKYTLRVVIITRDKKLTSLFLRWSWFHVYLVLSLCSCFDNVAECIPFERDTRRQIIVFFFTNNILYCLNKQYNERFSPRAMCLQLFFLGHRIF